MTKKAVALFAVGLMACTAMTAVNPSMARDKKPDLDANIVVDRPAGQSMVLTIPEVTSVFTNHFANTAVHSIQLKPDNGKYQYKIVGYSLNATYTLDVDIVSGKILKEQGGGKAKSIVPNIFNPRTVVSPDIAQAAAQADLGEGSISKGWLLAANDGNITYTIDMQQAGTEGQVTVDAKTGKVISKTEFTEIPPAPEPEPGTPLNKLFGFSRKGE